MLTLTVANFDNVVVNVKPIHLNKHVSSRVSYSYKEKLLSVRWKCSLKVRFKKNLSCKKSIFKDSVKIVQVYMVKFNVRILNRFKIKEIL